MCDVPLGSLPAWALGGVTFLILESPCPGLQFDLTQSQGWHHDLALSMCSDLYKTDYNALPVSLRPSWPPTWSGSSVFWLKLTHKPTKKKRDHWSLTRFKWILFSRRPILVSIQRLSWNKSLQFFLVATMDGWFNCNLLTSLRRSSPGSEEIDLRAPSEIPTYMKPGHVPVVIFLHASCTHSLWLNAGLTCTPRTPFFKRKNTKKGCIVLSPQKGCHYGTAVHAFES